jgi:outer membrane lipoprotein-sorting protein
MKTSENNKWLDDILVEAIGSEKRKPDFAKWQQEHPQAVQTLKSQAKRQTQPLGPINIGRIIMTSRITKFTAAAAIIILTLVIGTHYFGGSVDVATVAFGNVIGYLQTHSYTFDLTFEGTEKDGGTTPFTIKAMIMELGRMRFECSIMSGKLSSISDLNTGKTLLLFHQNKSGVLTEESVLKRDTGAQGILTLCTRPVASLWNLRNGSESQLGEKETDGRLVTGFKVYQKDKDFEYDITIWANSANNVPYLVEIISKPVTDKSFPVIKWTASNFDLDVKLDEKLFSLDVPVGYTLGDKPSLEDMKAQTQSSAQAKKIEQLLILWPEGKKTEALEILLGISWKEPINFGNELYIFSMTEQSCLSLKSEEQKQVNEDINKVLVPVREMSHEVLRLGQEAVYNRDYVKAEQYFNSGLQLGKLLTRNPDGIIIVRLVGLAIEKRILPAMINLYTTINSREKLQSDNEQLQAANAEAEEIKNKARAITSQ